MTNPTKLHIDLQKGTVDVEGDKDLIEKVYLDFKENLLAGRSRMESSSADLQERAKAQPLRRPRSSRTTTPEGAKPIYVPSLVKNLDTSKLAAFSAPYAPKNHSERVLLFVKFLETALKITPCTADQIYTCYKSARVKVPEAYEQALREARGNRYGYIDYKTLTGITATVRGANHFDHDGIRKAPE